MKNNQIIFAVILFMSLISLASACSPKIISSSLPSSIEPESSLEFNVTVVNLDEDTCQITISAEGEDMAFSPMSRNPTLSDEVTSKFTLSNGNIEGSKPITFEACYVGFLGETCDEKIITFQSTNDSQKQNSTSILLKILIGVLVVMFLVLIIYLVKLKKK